jgi:hypothetical protein
MPDVSGVTVVTNACAFYNAHAAADAPSVRHSLLPLSLGVALRPLFSEGRTLEQNSGASRGEIAEPCRQEMLLSEFESDPIRRSSSSAKADDPVFQSAGDGIEKPRRTGSPASAADDGLL